MKFVRNFSALLVLCGIFVGGCALLDNDAPKKSSSSGLISTPATYYSTAKARYLGTKYKDNLDRLIERIVRDPKTSALQFANNISSVGGIGFFTHSATKSPDERYLEVVLVTPETFEMKGAQSEKISRLFSLYGTALLGILSGDSEIFQDRELSGYGLNLAWRNVTPEPTGNRVSMERAILYFSKEDARKYLRHEVGQNGLLGDAVIFSVEEDGPLQLVSYKPQETRPDFRPAIREDNLASSDNSTHPSTPSAPLSAVTDSSPKTAQKSEPTKLASKPVEQPVPAAKAATVESKPETKAPIVIEQKSPAVVKKPAATAVESTSRENSVAPMPAINESKSETKEPIIAEQKTPVVVSKSAPPAVEPSTKDKMSPRPTVEPAAIAKASAEASPAGAKSAGAAKSESRVEPKPVPPAVAIVKTPAAESQAEKIVPAAPVVPDKKPVEPQKAVSVAEAKPRETIPPQAPVAKPVPAPLPEIKSSADAEAAPVKVENIPAALKRPVEVAGKPQASVEEVKPAEAPPPARETKTIEPVKAAPPPMVNAETALPAPQSVAPSSVSPQPEVVAEKAGGEQLALLRSKPIEVIPENKPAVKVAPKALEGFIVQLAFNDKEKALRWAEDMEKRGFAVSITEAGAEGRLRVRLGNFTQRDDAERQLRNLKQQGLNGIVINLPQGFQPEARSSMP
ncbi:MAG TPA: SPOR domain-containing protein [Terriglobales bacterium]|nr:SPOR domain-containing protein [Terriglobales bacterium]